MGVVQDSAAYYEEEDFVEAEQEACLDEEQYKTTFGFDNGQRCTHEIISLCNSIGAPRYFYDKLVTLL